MAQIPWSIKNQLLYYPGLTPIGQGKVRDTYGLDSDHLLVVASDRCSIFDFVLNTLIPQKGEVLTAMNHFWATKVLNELFQTDMLACGAGIDQYVLPHTKNVSYPEWQTRSTVVRRYQSPDTEDIVRLYLTGTGWESYQETGEVCGHKLPKGLRNGSKLPYPIYTPTDKATVGHDVHQNVNDVVRKYGAERERLAIQSICLMAAYAETRGLIIADSKEEIWNRVILDEKGTPDSSRYWDKKAYDKYFAKGKIPPSLDKQYVREWGKKLGIDKRKPEIQADVDYVHSLEVPADVIKMTTLIYRYIFWRLTGLKLERYQREIMGIDVAEPQLYIEVIVGSENDLNQIQAGLDILRAAGHSFRVNVMSCHRNPHELMEFSSRDLVTADVIISAAGKAAHLPGIVKSWLCYYDHPEIPVIGVALAGETSEDDRDATGSIKGVPSQPVELDDNGEAYWGPAGFGRACIAAANHEFLPKDIEVKPAQIGAVIFG